MEQPLAEKEDENGEDGKGEKKGAYQHSSVIEDVFHIIVFLKQQRHFVSII